MPTVLIAFLAPLVRRGDTPRATLVRAIAASVFVGAVASVGIIFTGHYVLAVALLVPIMMADYVMHRLIWWLSIERQHNGSVYVPPSIGTLNQIYCFFTSGLLVVVPYAIALGLLFR